MPGRHQNSGRPVGIPQLCITHLAEKMYAVTDSQFCRPLATVPGFRLVNVPAIPDHHRVDRRRQIAQLGHRFNQHGARLLGASRPTNRSTLASASPSQSAGERPGKPGQNWLVSTGCAREVQRSRGNPVASVSS